MKLTNGQWTTWCIGGWRNNTLISFLFDAHVRYWMKYDKAFDYFLFDYLIAYARDRVQKLRDELEAVGYNNVNALALIGHLNDEYEPDRLKEILDSGVLFKLSYKEKIRNDTDVNYHHL